MARKIWILGLSHSGTTIFWKAFRQDSRFLCFDEPLSESIGVHFLKNNAVQSLDEYISVLQRDPRYFWDLYQPIYPYQELDSGFTVEQEHYVRLLFDQSQDMVVDETHLHLHLPAILDVTPEAFVIHLHRRASAFVTSHLRPSLTHHNKWVFRIKNRLGHQYRKRVFWFRYDIPPGMTRNVLIGQHQYSKFGLMLADQGYDSEHIMNSSAVVRLLAYWHYHYHYLEREGPRLFGKRFLSLPYETFAHDPGGTMRRLYDWIGMAPPVSMDYAKVHRPKPSHQPRDRRWREAALIAGFTEEEIEALL